MKVQLQCGADCYASAFQMSILNSLLSKKFDLNKISLIQMVRQPLPGPEEHMDNNASRRMHPNDLQGFCLSCVGSKGNSILANISMLTKWANYTALLVLASNAATTSILSRYSIKLFL